MKTAKEVYEEVYYIMAVTDDGPLNYPQIMETAMIQYAKNVIDEMVSRGDEGYGGFIHGDTEFDDAFYNYDRIDEFKKNLK